MLCFDSAEWFKLDENNTEAHGQRIYSFELKDRPGLVYQLCLVLIECKQVCPTITWELSLARHFGCQKGSWLGHLQKVVSVRTYFLF